MTFFLAAFFLTTFFLLVFFFADFLAAFLRVDFLEVFLAAFFDDFLRVAFLRTAMRFLCLGTYLNFLILDRKHKYRGITRREMEVLVCGNPLVQEDALPIRIIPQLREANPRLSFKEYDPSEDLPKNNPLVIIDTVIDLKQVRTFTDIDDFATHKPLSVHGFDLGLTLKLEKKLKRLPKTIIIGVPPSLDRLLVVKEITNELKKITQT